MIQQKTLITLLAALVVFGEFDIYEFYRFLHTSCAFSFLSIWWGSVCTWPALWTRVILLCRLNFQGHPVYRLYPQRITALKNIHLLALRLLTSGPFHYRIALSPSTWYTNHLTTLFITFALYYGFETVYGFVHSYRNCRLQLSIVANMKLESHISMGTVHKYCLMSQRQQSWPELLVIR